MVVKGINDIPTVAPWMIKYFPGGEEEASGHTSRDSKKFKPICPYCGRLSNQMTTPNKIFSRHGISCVCDDGISMPNKMIWNIMDQSLKSGMIASYEREHTEVDKTGVTRKFDILFTELDGSKCFIEMDGGYHGEIIRKHRKNNLYPLPASIFLPDILKDELAEDLKIPMIRIDCYKSDVDYIKKNLYNSKLSDIINLDKIDWVKVEDFCFNNLMRDICEYKKQNPDKFASEISEVFNLTTQIIRKYLKRGVKLGLCEYNPREEAKRANAFRKFRSIKTYIKNIDTNEEWNFNSMTDFRNNSESILDGVKISKSMLEKRFSKTEDDSIIFDTGKHKFLIKKLRRE